MTQIPPLPPHPEPHSMTWTKLELAAISAYGDARAESATERAAKICERSAKNQIMALVTKITDSERKVISLECAAAIRDTSVR